MRVLFVHEVRGFQGGAERWVYQTSAGLGMRPGFECHLAFTQTAGRDVERFAGAFADTHHVVDPFEWRELIREVRPDVVCISNLAAAPFESLAEVEVPCVRVVHDHELSCLSGKRLYTWSGAVCERKLGGACWLCLGFAGRREGRWHRNRLAEKSRTLELTGKLAGVVVLSRYMRGELMRAGIPQDRIRVIPPGLEAPDSVDVSPWKRKAIRLLFAGQVIRGKGLDLLLRAMATLPETCELIVAGTGNALDKNRLLAGRLKLTDRVRFLGWQSAQALDRCYRDADLVVVPSRWPEPFGLVGLEAMSHARSVVAFDVGGISDWLEHGVTGLLVPPGSVADLGQALNQLIDQPELRKQMALAGRRSCLEKFSTEVMLDRLVACFEQVAVENPALESQFCET